MIVKLDGKQTLKAAKKQAYKGDYFDALTTCSRVDGYESLLNQIGCLTMTYDDTYALQMLGEVISRYVEKYDVFSDLKNLGDSPGAILRYYGLKPSFSHTAKTRETADASLVGTYDQFEEYGDVMEILEEEFSRLDAPVTDSVYDVHSDAYFQYLRNSVQSALLLRQTAKIRDLERKIIDYTPEDDAYVLETKVMVCFHSEDTEQAIEFAYKLAQLSDVTFPVLRRVIDVVIRFTDKSERSSVLRALMARALEICDEATDYYLRYLTLIALSESADEDIALGFALKLYDRYKDTGCLSLKLCAIAFYNARRFDLCKQAVLTFIRALPRNPFGRVMLEYLESDCVFTRMTISNNMGWYYDAPAQLLAFAMTKLNAKRQLMSPVLDSSDCVYLDFVCEVMRGAILSENFKILDANADCISEFVRAVEVEGVELFERFATKQLATPLQECFVNAELLARLLRLGFRKSLVITLESDAYRLDLSKFGCQDELFIDAFCVAACMRKVTFKRLRSAYDKLKDFTNLPKAYSEDLILNVTYFLLAASYKDYVGSERAEIFTDDERRLYDDYMNAAD